jgi:hypothetical protein
MNIIQIVFLPLSNNLKTMKKLLLASILLIVISSCETKEAKINQAKEAVMSFITSVPFENYDLMYKIYPTFKEVRSFWKVSDYVIQSANLNENTIIVVGKAKNVEILFEVEKIDGKYQITKSKGLCSDFNSDLYKYCKKIGCLGLNNYDSEISKICKEKELQFNTLVYQIKENIESNCILENHTVSKTYDWVSGDITLKNYSRFTIPGYSYNIYVLYKDNIGNTVFTSKESISNFESIPFGQGKTIHVYQPNSNSFQKISIKLEIISTKFIESIISENAEGINCSYSNNL